MSRSYTLSATALNHLVCHAVDDSRDNVPAHEPSLCNSTVRRQTFNPCHQPFHLIERRFLLVGLDGRTDGAKFLPGHISLRLGVLSTNGCNLEFVLETLVLTAQ